MQLRMWTTNSREPRSLKVRSKPWVITFLIVPLSTHGIDRGRKPTVSYFFILLLSIILSIIGTPSTNNLLARLMGKLRDCIHHRSFQLAISRAGSGQAIGERSSRDMKIRVPISSSLRVFQSFFRYGLRSWSKPGTSNSIPNEFHYLNYVKRIL